MKFLIRSAMCALMPSTAQLPGLDAGAADEYIAGLRSEADWLYTLGLVMGATVFALTPILTIGIPLPAFWLPRKALDRHAQRAVALPSYSLRQAVFLVRLNAGMAWGRKPEVRTRFALSPYAPDPGTWRTD